MSLSALQLASASVLALFAGSADAIHVQPMDDLGSHRVVLDLDWRTKRTASDVLTDLLDVDGIRVVAERRLWDRPDTLALRHDFDTDSPFHLFCAAGIDRAMYWPVVGTRRRSSMGTLAEVGAAWRLTGQLDVESDIRWVDPTRNVGLVGSGGTAALTLSLVWRGR